jgi:hypothetical protein
MAGFIRLAPAVALAMAVLQAAPAAAQAEGSRERWQVTLDGDQYLWNVGLAGLSGDTLLVRQADTIVPAPVARITELRLFEKTVVTPGEERESAVRALTATGDEVYDLSQLAPAERRRMIEKVLANRPAPTSE